jgi:hypothetical protein
MDRGLRGGLRVCGRFSRIADSVYNRGFEFYYCIARHHNVMNV